MFGAGVGGLELDDEASFEGSGILDCFPLWVTTEICFATFTSDAIAPATTNFPHVYPFPTFLVTSQIYYIDH